MHSIVLARLGKTRLPIPGADPWYAEPTDPALGVMTDFRERPSVTVSENATIDAALEQFVSRQTEALSILDLGTGSGALLCALLDVFPRARGLGLDLSPEACGVARENLARCALAPRATIRQGGWDAAPGSYDLIVSNPPYIPSADIADLAPEVRLFDPRLALDGGIDGLDAYRQIVALLPGLLAEGGLAILEVGLGQAGDVAALLTAAGLEEITIKADLAGVGRAVSGYRAGGLARSV